MGLNDNSEDRAKENISLLNTRQYSKCFILSGLRIGENEYNCEDLYFHVG